MTEIVNYCQGHPITRPQAAKKANPWPGDPNAYECPWGCNGTGDLPWFAHIAEGVCFACKGQGWILGRGGRQPDCAAGSRPPRQPAQRPPGARRWRKEGGRIIPA